MKLKFEIEIEVPEASEYAKSVFEHICINDYTDSTNLGYQLCEDIISELEDNWNDIIPSQIPKDYQEKYNRTLNSLL